MHSNSRVLDLNAARRARAIARGRKQGPFPLFLGVNEDGSDNLLAMLPPELPIDALEPFTRIDLDMALLFRTIMDAVKDGDTAAGQIRVLDMLVDLMVQTPRLPAQIVEAVREMGRRVLGDDGYERFMAERPSAPDIVDLVKGLGREWGVGLGESRPPSGGSDAGQTSTPTSPTPTESTSLASGTTPEIPDSSASTSSSGSATDSPPMPG